MLTIATTVSKIFKSLTRTNRQRNCVFLLLLAIVCVALGQSFAQEFPPDPEDRFYDLLEEVSSVDRAREIVAHEYRDEAVAADIAVYLCSPPAEEKCRGSDVFAAWDDFLERIYTRDESASEAAQGMEQRYGEYLAYGVAVSYCSSDTFEGCDGDPITEAWGEFDRSLIDDPNPARAISRLTELDPLVAELIAASECGERTCYSDLLKELDFDQGAQSDRPQPHARQQPTRGGLQYGFKPDMPEPDSIKRICATDRARREIARCQRRAAQASE